jgi:hypothetical protein
MGSTGRIVGCGWSYPKQYANDHPNANTVIYSNSDVYKYANSYVNSGIDLHFYKHANSDTNVNADKYPYANRYFYRNLYSALYEHADTNVNATVHVYANTDFYPIPFSYAYSFANPRLLYVPRWGKLRSSEWS